MCKAVFSNTEELQQQPVGLGTCTSATSEELDFSHPYTSLSFVVRMNSYKHRIEKI